MICKTDNHILKQFFIFMKAFFAW